MDEILKKSLSDSGHEVDLVNGLINGYEKYLITDERLVSLGKDPIQCDGLDKSVEDFYILKNKYIDILGESKLDEEIVIEPMNTRKAGFSNFLILGLVAIGLCMLMLVLGVYLTV